MPENETICAIIPLYKVFPTKNEMYSIKIIFDKFPGKDIYFVAPQGFSNDAYCNYKGNWIFFPSYYFKSEKTYSRLLLKTSFYKKFQKYGYMLLCQTDAIMLGTYENLLDFTNKGYDYFGAPWFSGKVAYKYAFRGLSFFKEKFDPKLCFVGNGGFSLRNVEKIIRLLEEKKRYRLIWNSGEDVFFAYHGQQNLCGFVLAPIEIAEKFALEEKSENLFNNIKITMGVHAWEKYCPKLLEYLENSRIN